MSEMLSKAISFSCRAHASQWRKDKQTPYVAHPVRVMMIVCREFGVASEPILAAAVLHDVIEDTSRDYDSISFHFGSEVADLVAALSKDCRMPEEEREAAYDAQLREGPWQARLIKLADCYDNYTDAVDDEMQSRARLKAHRGLELLLESDPPEVHSAAQTLKKLLEQH